MLKTTDGGQTWTEITIPDGGSLQGVGFVTPEIGWTSGRGVSSVTTDGGQTWARIDIEPDEPGVEEGINRFRFVGDVGYAAGHYIYKLDASTVAAEPGATPVAATLISVAPNPAGGAVTATFRLERPGPVEVAVYDLLGREVAVLSAGERAAGTHTVRWGADVPAGTYLVRLRLRTAEGAWARPVTVVRR